MSLWHNRAGVSNQSEHSGNRTRPMRVDQSDLHDSHHHRLHTEVVSYPRHFPWEGPPDTFIRIWKLERKSLEKEEINVSEFCFTKELWAFSGKTHLLNWGNPLKLWVLKRREENQSFPRYPISLLDINLSTSYSLSRNILDSLSQRLRWWRGRALSGTENIS